MLNKKVLMIGAHPDDCDVMGTGFTAMLIDKGYHVKYISLTNGCCGHQTMPRKALAKRRDKECKQVEKTLGIEYGIWDVEDGGLIADLKNRKRIIKEIRNYNPDIIVTHRLNDYHPDHRNTSLLVQDASYLLIVPNVCKNIPPLKKTPVILYFSDNFSNPDFRADIVVGIDKYIDKKFEVLACHESQVYEWLPYTVNSLNEVPKSKEERLKWLKSPKYDEKIINEMLKNKKLYSFGECKQAIEALKFKKELAEKYGENNKIKYCEAFEISEYSGITDKDKIYRIWED